MTVMSFSVYVKCNSAWSYGKPRRAQPAGGGGGADEGFGRLQAVIALAGLLLQGLSVDREALRAKGIHYFEPCDGWAGEQVMGSP